MQMSLIPDLCKTITWLVSNRTPSSPQSVMPLPRYEALGCICTWTCAHAQMHPTLACGIWIATLSLTTPHLVAIRRAIPELQLNEPFWHSPRDMHCLPGSLPNESNPVAGIFFFHWAAHLWIPCGSRLHSFGEICFFLKNHWSTGFLYSGLSAIQPGIDWGGVGGGGGWVGKKQPSLSSILNSWKPWREAKLFNT